MWQKFLVIMAAGQGSRMETDIPKQFLEIGGKAILHLTIEKFVRAIPDIRIITVLPKEHMSYWRNYCIKKDFYIPQTLVEGGITRYHSVKNGLDKVSDGSLVAVHDGVRPLVSVNLIKELFEEVVLSKAVAPIIPTVDTVKFFEKNNAKGSVTYSRLEEASPNRDKLFSVQTPQVFHSDLLKKVYNESGFNLSFTDDTSVVEASGIEVVYKKGERFNLKLTTPDDILLAEAILNHPQKL